MMNSFLYSLYAIYASGEQTYDESVTRMRRIASTNNNVGPAESPPISQAFVVAPVGENISRLFTPTGFGSATNQRRNDDDGDEQILYYNDTEVFDVVDDEPSLSLLSNRRIRYRNLAGTNKIINNVMSYVLNWIFGVRLNRTEGTVDSYVDEINIWNTSLSNVTNIDEEQCPELSIDQSISYATYGVCIPIIAFIGVLMNMASFIVLTRSSMRSSINMYLAGLSFFDGFLLLSSLLVFPPIVYCDVASWCSKNSPWCQYVQNTAPVTYPLINIMQTGSIWTLTAITVDRFVAITWPLKSRDLLTVRRALLVLSAIAIWSLVYNIPTFFELEFDENGALVPSKLRDSTTYIVVYKSYCYLFFMFLIPAVVMVVLNVYITVAVRRAYRVRRQLCGRDEKERRATLMAVLVVCTFLVLNLTANITNCVEAFTPNFSYKSFVHIGNLLVTVNSATNFFIYCALSLRFRQMFCKLFCPFCYTPEKEYQYLSAYFGSGRGNHGFGTNGAASEPGGIISMRSLRRPLISSPTSGPQRHSQNSRHKSSTGSVGHSVIGGNNNNSSRKPTMKVDFSQRNKNLVSRRPPAYD